MTPVPLDSVYALGEGSSRRPPQSHTSITTKPTAKIHRNARYFFSITGSARALCISAHSRSLRAWRRSDAADLSQRPTLDLPSKTSPVKQKQNLPQSPAQRPEHQRKNCFLLAEQAVHAIKNCPGAIAEATACIPPPRCAMQGGISGFLLLDQGQPRVGKYEEEEKKRRRAKNG